MTSPSTTRRNVNVAALDPQFRKKIKNMMDLFEEATEIRKELIAAGIHVKFLRHAGIIAYAREIKNPVALNEIVIEEAIQRED